MAADERVLGDLHTAVARALAEAMKGQEIPGYLDEETGEETTGGMIPPSAAIIQAATKFLKDNNITCQPSKDNALGELEQIMLDRKNKRLASRDDLRAATEQTSFLTGLPN